MKLNINIAQLPELVILYRHPVGVSMPRRLTIGIFRDSHDVRMTGKLLHLLLREFNVHIRGKLEGVAAWRTSLVNLIRTSLM